MSTYISFINELIRKQIAELPNAVVYGENINTGSHLSGLTRNVKPGDGSLLINAGNCEYTHCGIGFGVMLGGATAVLCMKQLDFMLLGVDHFVSTYHNIRCHRDPSTLGSFTVIVVAYDQGFQGPQSSFNALGDVCSLARVSGFTLTNDQDSAHILSTQLGQPGFRFIVLSQRLSPKEVLQLSLVRVSEDSGVFQYTEGDDVTIACLNFSLPEGIQLQQKLRELGLSSSVFSINSVSPHDWSWVRQSVARTGRLIVFDDSKSAISAGYALAHEAAEASPASQRIVVTREAEIDFGVSPETFQVDYDALLSKILENRPAPA